jgi:hypothetical protein
LKSGLSKLTCPFISVGKLALRTGLIESAVASLEFQCSFQLAEMSTADSIKPVLNANLPTEINGQVSLDNSLFNS